MTPGKIASKSFRRRPQPTRVAAALAGITGAITRGFNRPVTRRFALGIGLGAALIMGAAPAHAADPAYPSQPIRLVVPFAPGGSLDLTGRILADRLREVLGQPVLVTNRPGAGSAVGARAVATAPADGYTLFLTSASAFGLLHLLVPGFEHRLSDFAPIGAVATNSSIIVVNSGVAARTLPELVDLSRKQPGGLSFCTTGAGGMNHLQLEMFRSLVKARSGGKEFPVTHVPYNGVAPAIQGLKSQEVQACTLPYSALVRNLDGKDLRIVAVMRPTRMATMPNVPTTGEQGYPEMDGNDAYVNLSAPKGTPAAVLAKLESVMAQVLHEPETLRKLTDIDVQPTWVDARGTQKWLEEDVRKFSGVIREAGMGAK